MPATITLPELAVALRLTSDPTQPLEEPLQSILLRQLETAREMVNQYANTAPEMVQNSAIVSICSYLFDGSSLALNNAPAQDALAMSGAKSLLSPYHVSPGVTV